MGGQAFAHLTPKLATPRMPREIYTQVLSQTHAILKQHYELVGSPIEGPEKDTFGDVDILVFSPKPDSPLYRLTFQPEIGTRIASLLESRHHIMEKGNATINFAILWPRAPDTSTDREGIDEEEKYIQLDIKFCTSVEMYSWELFHNAHGDLWNILGSTIRQFGLTVNNLGLYLRIPQIECIERKKSMVFLTDSPSAILGFLGLDEEMWWREFRTRREMFEYAAGCRMFWIKDLGDGEDEKDGVGAEIEGQEGGLEGQKKLKHNDRQRMRKRPIFNEWMQDFIPKCREDGRFIGSSNVTREQIREEAFETFGEKVRETYEVKLREWMLERHTDEVWRDVIKGNIPEEGVDPQFRAAAIRTIKGVVIGGEGFDGKMVPEVARDDEGFWDLDKVKKWVVGNWKRAGEIGWARQQQRAIEGIKAKVLKKSFQDEEKATKQVKVGESEVA